MTLDKNMARNQRRDFLKFIGKAGVALPLLQASTLGAGILLGRQAEAQGTSPKRIIFVYVPDGTPEGAAKSYVPASGMTLQSCSAPLEAVKQHCIFFRDTEVVGGGGHGNSQRVLGTFATGVSATIDLALEGTVGATSPLAAIRLGVRTLGVDPISARVWTGVTDYQDNPQSAFEKLFGGSVASGTGSSGSIAATRELKLLEINKAALATIKTKLGSYELQRLQQHEAAIAKLQTDIQNSTGGTAGTGCTNPAWSAGGRSTELVDSNFTDLFALQTENIVLAMKCNITRIATLQLGTHQSEFGVTGLTGTYHGSVHSNNLPSYIAFRTYLTERVAYLIKRLTETDDPMGGKLIDSTLVLQVTDMGDGNTHGGIDAPFMMAGGGTAVNRGRVISVANHHMLLDTVAQYMGAYNAIPHYSSSPATGILV
jgi:hypothetical protein